MGLKTINKNFIMQISIASLCLLAASSASAFTAQAPSRTVSSLQMSEVNDDEAAMAATAAITTSNGWVPDSNKFAWGLPEYFPGDIGFDPLGLKPESYEDFAEMSTKELQQGRLAMLAVAG